MKINNSYELPWRLRRRWQQRSTKARSSSSLVTGLRWIIANCRCRKSLAAPVVRKKEASEAP